jgi:SagB-type dehydrogenase family enzyme
VNALYKKWLNRNPLKEDSVSEENHIFLPDAAHRGDKSVEEVLFERRSVRDFSPEALSLADLAQLLWSAQGITGEEGLKTTPSAGALYPLEVYAVVAKVKGIPTGFYKYHPATNSLEMIAKGDARKRLAEAALDQTFVKEAPLVLVIAAVYERITGIYGSRGMRYVHMEVGHAAENVYLQAGALGLGTVIVGAFNDAMIQQILDLPEFEQPLCLLPVGRK